VPGHKYILVVIFVLSAAVGMWLSVVKFVGLGRHLCDLHKSLKVGSHF